MKHIKQKFELEMTHEEFHKKVPVEKGEEVLMKDVLQAKIDSSKAAFINTDEGMWISAFQHKIDNVFHMIPEPNPILIYFNNAQIGFRGIASSKAELVKSLDLTGVEKKFTSEISHKLYGYMFAASNCSLFLFTAIETMINKSIPNGFNFVRKNRKLTELYDVEQIQRFLSFETKLKEVLPLATGKDFTKSHPKKYQYIMNLKEFRDTIMHTKKSSDDHTPYSHIFKAALNFKYEETMLAVRDLINFYFPNLVEECKCGQDF